MSVTHTLYENAPRDHQPWRTRSSERNPTDGESFGLRAEKILRFAEDEAADVRARAAKDAAALLDQARAKADRHRLKTEQSLITRAVELDQEAAQREIALQEREKQATAMLAAAREEAVRITDAARQEADDLIADARSQAEEERQHGKQEERRRREAAEKELRRIAALREDILADLARLHALVGTELGSPPGGPGIRAVG